MDPQKNLATALAAFQAELPKLVRDETASVKGVAKNSGREYDRSYSYADLAQVCETVLPVLGKHGLSITSGTVILNNGFVLEVTLLHESGEERTAVWPLPDPMRTGPQDLGSAMTYGRRYLTLALTGTFPGGEDDDGAKAQSRVRESWDAARPRQEEPPAPAPKDWSKATDAEVREMHAKIENNELASAIKGYDWMAGVGLHERKIEVETAEGPIGITATELLAARLADEAVRGDADLRKIAICRAYAEDRALLKVAVSASTTLDEELALARDSAAAAISQATAEVEKAGS